MTVLRFVTLLIMLAFVFTNGPAIAMAMCQHNDARAHAAALQSPDSEMSVKALSEEIVAKAASGQGSLGEAATTLLAGYILPPEPLPLPLRFVEPMTRDPTDVAGRRGRSVPPLLEPPLA